MTIEQYIFIFIFIFITAALLYMIYDDFEQEAKIKRLTTERDVARKTVKAWYAEVSKLYKDNEDLRKLANTYCKDVAKQFKKDAEKIALRDKRIKELEDKLRAADSPSASIKENTPT